MKIKFKNQVKDENWQVGDILQNRKDSKKLGIIFINDYDDYVLCPINNDDGCNFDVSEGYDDGNSFSNMYDFKENFLDDWNKVPATLVIGDDD